MMVEDTIMGGIAAWSPGELTIDCPACPQPLQNFTPGVDDIVEGEYLHS